MDTTLKVSAAIVVVVVAALIAVVSSGLLSSSAAIPVTNTYGTGNVTVYFFYGEECSHCHVVMPVVVNLSKKYPDIEFHILEIWHDQKNYTLYSQMSTDLNNPHTGVPVVFVGRTILYGELEIPQYLEAAIQDAIKKKS